MLILNLMPSRHCKKKVGTRARKDWESGGTIIKKNSWNIALHVQQCKTVSQHAIASKLGISQSR